MMRSHVLVAAVVLSFGCDAAQQLEMTDGGEHLARSSVPTWDEYFAMAVAVDNGGYVAESDLWFPDEAALRSHYDNNVNVEADKAHVWTQGLANRLIWPGTKAQDIRYCINKTAFDVVNNSYYGRIAADMEEATRQWEALANIDLRHVAIDATCTPEGASTMAQVDFVVGPFFRSIRGCADPPWLQWDYSVGPQTSKFCYQGTSASTEITYRDVLSINYIQIDGEAAAGSPITPVGVLRHELGHKLGFRHEHPWNSVLASSCQGMERPDFGVYYGVEAVPGLAYDELSVMHYPAVYCGVEEGIGPPIGYAFSPGDGASARAVYGMPVSWYVASGVI